MAGVLAHERDIAAVTAGAAAGVAVGGGDVALNTPLRQRAGPAGGRRYRRGAAVAVGIRDATTATAANVVAAISAPVRVFSTRYPQEARQIPDTVSRITYFSQATE
ncbi:hypothetical protein GCM10010528_13640 [Gordonia defluvii]|uniref:Uncharacterized protein n=1 Tax=Gordonia defluvii TaxID=283718 RepID=A0ABP6L7L2_9ACTN